MSEKAAAMSATHPPSPQDLVIVDTSSPPDGGYGWVVVCCCLAFNCFTWGVTSSYGVYLSQYLSTGLFPEATPLDYGFVGGFNFAFAMLVAPLVTILTREFGKHWTLSIGALLQCGGYVAASFTTKVWQLYLSQGTLVGMGIGFIIIPSVAILSQWFSRKRTIANGISSAGSGLGGMLFSWGTAAMIRRIGLRWTLRGTGIVTLAANLIATVFIRDRNQHIQPPQLAFDIRLVRRYEVALLLLWAFVTMFGYITLLFSLSDFALSIGLSPSQATDIVGFLNLGTAAGRPIIGVVSDKYQKIETAGVLTLVCGVSCFAFWLPATEFGLTVFFAILCGAILGVFWMTIGPLCAEVVGLKDLPSALSLAWTTIIIPTACSEPIALQLRRPGSPREYLYPQIFAGLSYIVASGIMYELRRVMRKKRDAIL
ncbi:related to protein MCH2 (monocarboxylate permease homolog) [Cephalotrichum gorgonifer]|uniref:Related to protein MCH2 (Monocarboxylate permease homolog) n=1 Tax=Cephalotrichum gorgonifer TaxID=2041049 RepID=A0AAE8N648_9PEZI|nr:related to protein MCH2 (monocarboxylate permease homolog) [Cephalotrichum gorgonifer]